MIRALVVDDDEDLLEMVTLMLSSSGMQVIQLSSGRKLLATVEAESPDIVLMDIFLGDGDGRELCKSLKAQQSTAATKVILYSAGTLDPATIQKAGADDFIAKPFDMYVLIDKVKGLVSTPRSSE